MAFLYYWTQERFLADNLEPLEPGDLAFSQDSAVMARIRDARLWVFTKDRRKVHVLAASVMVSHTVEQNVPGGGYRIVAVPDTSCRYRLLNPTKEVESAIRSLSIAKDWDRDSLGTYLRGHNAVKEISSGDDAILERFAEQLQPATFGYKWSM
jgi:hypothetical protein